MKLPKKESFPDKPKQPLGPFFLYMKDHMEKEKANFPSLSHLDITKQLSKKWGELSQQKKSKYVKASLEEREKYQEEMKAFL